MKTTLKVVLAIVGVLVALIVAAVIFLPLFFNPNDYKDEIAQIVETRTGRELRISGDIGLSVFPWLGVELGRIELANAPGFPERPFAAIESAAVRIKLLPLLFRQEIQIGNITLEGLTLRLAQNAKGGTNWDDMVERLGSQAESGKPAPEPTPEDEGGYPITSLQVEGVEVVDAQVFWTDLGTDTRYRLTNFSLRTGAIALGEPFMLSSSFNLESNKPPMTADVDLSTEVVATLQPQAYSLNDMRLTVLASGERVPGGQQEVILTGNAKVDLAAGTAQVRDLKLEAAGLVAHAQATGSGITTDKAEFQGQLRMEQFSPRDLMERLGIAVPPTSDESALARASLETGFTATSTQARLRDLTLVLDDSKLTGTAAVTDYAVPAIRFDLAVDNINVDRYLPPEAEDTAAQGEETPAEGGGVNDTEISLGVLKGLNVAGKLTVGKLQAMGLQMSDAQVEVAVRDGVLQVEPLAAKLYGGQIRSTATVSAKGEQTYALTADIKGIQAGPLLQDMMEFKLIDGTGELTLDLHAAGATVGAVRQALVGDAAFAFRNGAINGFNLAHIIRVAKARLSGGSVSDAEVKKTDFTSLTGSLQVNEGVLKNDDLALKSPLFRVNGQGTINLVKNRLDYLIKTSVVGTLKGQGGADLQSLKGLTIPVRLNGDLLSPGYSLDLAGMLAQSQGEKVEQVRQKAEQRIEEEKQELRKDLREKAGEKLKGLFN